MIGSALFDPDQTADRRHPFATIVTKDYPSFDTSSELDRPGVFRLNLAVGRETFQRLFGFPPTQFADHAAQFDFTELERILPHPVYARQSWISVLTPGPRASDQVRDLISHAHRQARGRYPNRPVGLLLSVTTPGPRELSTPRAPPTICSADRSVTTAIGAAPKERYGGRPGRSCSRSSSVASAQCRTISGDGQSAARRRAQLVDEHAVRGQPHQDERPRPCVAERALAAVGS